MKVIVCGGRDFRSPAQVWYELDEINKKTPFSELMHGGATGVDTFAKEWAIARQIPRLVCKAEWDKYGLAAGPIRNAKMLEWNPDLVIAFPGGKGTADMVTKTKAANIKLIEVKYD